MTALGPRGSALAFSTCVGAYRILVHQPGVEPASPALKGKLSTTRPPGKSINFRYTYTFSLYFKNSAFELLMGKNILLCSTVRLCASLLILYVYLIVLSLPSFSKSSSELLLYTIKSWQVVRAGTRILWSKSRWLTYEKRAGAMVASSCLPHGHGCGQEEA